MIAPSHSEVDHGVIKQGVLTAAFSALVVGLIGWALEEAKARLAESRARAKAERGET